MVVGFWCWEKKWWTTTSWQLFLNWLLSFIELAHLNILIELQMTSETLPWIRCWMRFLQKGWSSSSSSSREGIPLGKSEEWGRRCKFSAGTCSSSSSVNKLHQRQNVFKWIGWFFSCWNALRTMERKGWRCWIVSVVGEQFEEKKGFLNGVALVRSARRLLRRSKLRRRCRRARGSVLTIGSEVIWVQVMQENRRVLE